MFNYPKKTHFRRVLPKNKIYAHTKASKALQARFVDQVVKITWLCKLAPETLNVPASKAVQEIEIFEIQLKQAEVHQDILRAIDRTIRHPIAYQLRFQDQVRYVMPSKRPNEADSNKWVIGEYFSTDWQTFEAPSEDLPVVLNMAALYEQLLRAHLSIPARPNESLTDQVARITALQQKQSEVDKLQSRLSKIKQFNRKVELNQQLRSLKLEVEALYNA
jgi:hypothetical protein